MTFNPVPKPQHKRRIPKRKNRGSFSKTTRRNILERENGCCQMCGKRATQIHHVKPKSSGKGRGVETNGMAVCGKCHNKIHADNELLQHWINVFEDKYGHDFYRDEWG